MKAQKPTLLLADDEYANMEAVLSFIEDEVGQVLYAPDGQVAYEIATEKLPDIIIMDWQMPNLNGLEAIRLLQATEKTKEIPVIVATGIMTSSTHLQEALENGAVEFLTKPFVPIEFKARIRAAIRIRDQHLNIRRMLLNEQELLNKTLHHKRRELTTQAILDHQKNHLSARILEHLQSIDGLTQMVYATDISVLTQELNAHFNLDESWERFKIHFGEVHKGFFDRLHRQFPTLNRNAQKLCAYMRMGMGNYEICEMTGANDMAVRRALNRLKKRLGLTAGDDIRQFLFEL